MLTLTKLPKPAFSSRNSIQNEIFITGYDCWHYFNNCCACPRIFSQWALCNHPACVWIWDAYMIYIPFISPPGGNTHDRCQNRSHLISTVQTWQKVIQLRPGINPNIFLPNSHFYDFKRLGCKQTRWGGLTHNLLHPQIKSGKSFHLILFSPVCAASWIEPECGCNSSSNLVNHLKKAWFRISLDAKGNAEQFQTSLQNGSDLHSPLPRMNFDQIGNYNFLT